MGRQTATPAPTEAGAQISQVPVGALVPPRHNHRRTSSEEGLRELADSIRARGVLEPIIVRPGLKAGTFEIVAGWRRYLASKLAEQETIPAIIRTDLDDAAAAEVQTIENLQREDVPPLEEAEGFQYLLDRHQGEMGTVAAKVGKSRTYVAQRLRLLQLIPKFREFLKAGKLPVGHALLVARLPEATQKELLEHGEVVRTYGGRVEDVVSVSRLQEAIRARALLSLDAAPWKKDDADLLPAAGPCTTCPKRSGNATDLFPEIKQKEVCTDAGCFGLKLQAFVARVSSEIKRDEGKLPVPLTTESSWGEAIKPGKPVPLNQAAVLGPKDQTCDYLRTGLIVQDEHLKRIGQRLRVCVEPKCKTHHGGHGLASEQMKRSQKERAQATRRRTEMGVRQEVLRRITLKIEADVLPRADLEMVASEFFGRVWHEGRKRLAGFLAVEAVKGQYGKDWESPVRARLPKMTDAELCRFLVACALITDTSLPTYSAVDTPRLLWTAAKRYRIDPEVVRRELRDKDGHTRRVSRLRGGKKKAKA